ncbi:hypothetical protein ABID19_002052 [Mesorhizobium robiniae]|uniref:Lipo-like protein n=1 Tax=Mesorhizobium robiniae TaxID=559315 RepID=A0ABV2GL55_9HYPH
MIETGDTLLDRLGRWLAGRLQEESSGYEPYTPSDAETLRRTLEPGDILLIEGNQKISAAIKYLTQSTWSHAAFYVGDALPEPEDGSERRRLIEVTLGDGCIAVPLSRYRTYNTRICRASGLGQDIPLWRGRYPAEVRRFTWRPISRRDRNSALVFGSVFDPNMDRFVPAADAHRSMIARIQLCRGRFRLRGLNQS